MNVKIAEILGIISVCGGLVFSYVTIEQRLTKLEVTQSHTNELIRELKTKIEAQQNAAYLSIFTDTVSNMD